jgi:putative oxidoreductase
MPKRLSVAGGRFFLLLESMKANRYLHSRASNRGSQMSFLKPFTPQLLSVLRIMSGLFLLHHGTAKYLNFPVGPMNHASPMTMGGAAGLIELVFGALLVIGLFTRLAAFIASGMTAVAYFYVHARRGFFPILNGGELAALYAFVLLYIAAAGGGPWSVDRALRSDD